MRAPKPWGYLLSLLLVLLAGCRSNYRSAEETAVIADLIVLAEIRTVGGHQKLVAKEVLKGQLGKAAGYGLGDEIPVSYRLPDNMGGTEHLALLFYAERSGGKEWLMTVSGSGPNAKLVEALRNHTFLGPQPREAFSWEKSRGVILALAGALALFAFTFWLACILDRKWLAAHAAHRHFRWGYLQALCCIYSGIFWLISLLEGFQHGLMWLFWIVYGVVAPFAGYELIRFKKRWAWLFITIVQLNLLNWIINYFYGRNRWKEFMD